MLKKSLSILCLVFILSGCQPTDSNKVFTNDDFSIKYDTEIFQLIDDKLGEYDFYIQDRTQNAVIYIWSDEVSNLASYNVNTVEELANLMMEDYLGDQFDASVHLPLKQVDIDGYNAFVCIFQNGEVYIIEREANFFIVDGSDYSDNLELLDSVLKVLHSFSLK